MLKKIISKLEEINYEKYLNEFKLNELNGINAPSTLNKDVKKWETISPDNNTPSPPEFDDLIRIHFLILLLKSRVVMEFGVGKSTAVILDALKKNKVRHSQYVMDNLRITNPFNLYSVDNSDYWLNKVKEEIGQNSNWYPHLSDCNMGEFNGRICTYYQNLPNIKPDFIYLDAPSQFGINGAVRGISTNSSDRMPMAADILSMEYFLEPGTFILVDGRTANARFLKNNFQREWEYEYLVEYDQHYFWLNESPLGKWNKESLLFTEIF